MKGGTLRGALLGLLAIALTSGLIQSALAADSKLVVVEFQPATDDDAGLAYLLYSTVSESLTNDSGDTV
ncbi:MAG: hypothetical protein QGH45_14370, partial [Myxococcota bacterium]|nr:hypothetical protein [Myxococcota bacterium]